VPPGRLRWQWPCARSCSRSALRRWRSPGSRRARCSVLREALGTSVAALRADLDQARHGLTVAEARLSGLYASSRAPDVWALVLGLGPLTRSELARALGVTKRTASQGAEALIAAGLAVLRPSDGALHSVDLQKLARD
jgi:DNA-binding transcriptional ArsR family regulator